MTLQRWDVINAIADLVGAQRYLEIGVAVGETMQKVRIAEKWGVDPAPQASGIAATDHLVAATSDLFFSLAGLPGFDVVFIDGWHEAGQVLRDVAGALRVLSPHGVIVLHDCNPENAAMQAPLNGQYFWTGDCWKAAVTIRADGKHALRVVESDFGIGVLVPNRASAPVQVGKPLAELVYADLAERRQELLGLLAPSEWCAWFEQRLRS